MSKKLISPEEHHEQVVKGLYDQMKPVFDSSEQPIFLYLDDNHKACNSKFAKMLGFKSPQEWAETPSVLGVSVAGEKSRNIGDGVLGCDEEKDSLNHSDYVDEERRRHR